MHLLCGYFAYIPHLLLPKTLQLRTYFYHFTDEDALGLRG